VHLLERRPAVLDLLAGDDLEVADLRSGVRATVHLDEADDDVLAPFVPTPALVEHGVGLADARGCALVDAQAASSHQASLSTRRHRCASSARLSSSTFTPFSPRKP